MMNGYWNKCFIQGALRHQLPKCMRIMFAQSQIPSQKGEPTSLPMNIQCSCNRAPFTKLYVRFIDKFYIFNIKLSIQPILQFVKVMIPSINPRLRKSSSFALQPDNKDNKENYSTNVQAQRKFQAFPKKISKIRSSLGPLAPQIPKLEAIQNSLNALHIVSKNEIQQMHLHLKKQYSFQTKKDYSQDILSHMISKRSQLGSVLSNHMITPQLRAKMVDWMIQVISSYKMSEECFFLSVRYMDKIFKNCQKKLEVSDLHLVGVTAMFVASKYEEIYPFKLNIIYDKICRKKFTKQSILEMQEQLMQCLSFQLQQVTPFDLIRHLQYEMNIPLEPKQEEYFHKICIYLAKMSMHCSELAWIQENVLAASVLFIGLKTVQQVESSIKGDDYLQIIGELTWLPVSQVVQTSQKLLNIAKTFNKMYPSLCNLKKFNNAQYCQ